MGKVLIKMAIKSVVVALVLSAGVVTTANAEITRLSGANRYLTSDAIVKAGWSTGAETAVLASGLDANIVDALTVAPFAKTKNAPVVIVNPKDSVATIVAKFTALNAKTVYIANGTGVISTDVEKGLKEASITTVTRLGGANRYETALNIAKAFGASTSIVVANGDAAHLVDSLSIAPIAAAKGMPIFLSGRSLDAATSAYIEGLGGKTTYVIGETDTVSDVIAKELPGVIRLAGTTRYETNANVVDNFKSDTSLNFNNIFIASGENVNLIDALAGAPLAASKGAPIIFIHDNINSYVNKLLKTIINTTTKITELGGISAVTPLATYDIDTIQTGIDNNTAVTFPDKQLEQIIRDKIKKPNGDILKSDVEMINRFSPYSQNISNITGIEHMINLNYLDLSYNQISNIEPIKGLTNLYSLELNGNIISNIEPLQGLTNLYSLQVNDNLISNIEPLQGLTNLIILDLSKNQISNIESLKGLTELVGLSLADNQIINIDPLRKLTKLTRLYIPGNQIINLGPLRELTKLRELKLGNNQITNLEPLSKLAHITTLDLENNKIIDLEPLSKLTYLSMSHLENNKIIDLEPLSELTYLRRLMLQNNQITNLEPLRDLTKLSWLKLENNQITDYTPIDFYHEVTPEDWEIGWN
jgi:Leucine-rich repeat (LRR) protein/putative cell wall-binding protein